MPDRSTSLMLSTVLAFQGVRGHSVQSALDFGRGRSKSDGYWLKRLTIAPTTVRVIRGRVYVYSGDCKKERLAANRAVFQPVPRADGCAGLGPKRQVHFPRRRWHSC
jgi:hypothetical protein